MQLIFLVLGIFYLALIVFMVATMWKINVKANQPGWTCLVPIYNIIVLLRVAKKPEWWILLYFIPIINLIYGIKTIHGISTNFGKDVGFTVGLIFLGFIFYPILAFGSAQYIDNVGHNPDLLD